MSNVPSQRFRDLIEASDSIEELSKICEQAIREYKVSNDGFEDIRKVSSDTDRMLCIIEKKKVLLIHLIALPYYTFLFQFWESMNNSEMVLLSKRYHDDEIFVSELTDQGIKTALKCCLDKRRKMILIKCWDIIYHLPKDLHSSRTALIVAASITGASLPIVAKYYLRMIETGFSCEPEDEFLLKKLVIRLIKSMSYFGLLFNQKYLQEALEMSNMKNVTFEVTQQDAINQSLYGWSGSVIKTIEEKVTSQFSKVESIDFMASVAEIFDVSWKSELDQDSIQSASVACGTDVSLVKSRFDQLLRNHISLRINSQLSDLFSNLQSIGSGSRGLGSSFVWNFADADSELKFKSHMIIEDKPLSDFNRHSKLFLDNCSSLYQAPKCEVIEAAQESLREQLSTQITSIANRYQQNQNDMLIVGRCNGLLYNSSLHILFSSNRQVAEKLLHNLRNEKSIQLILPRLDILMKKLAEDLQSRICSRELYSDSSDKTTAVPSWLPRSISYSLQNFLTGIGNEINSSFGHCFPDDLYTFIWKTLLGGIISSYSSHFDLLSNKSKSVPIRETYAGQAYFDLLFLKQILSFQESIKNECTALQTIVKNFESFLDPFDLHLLSSELHTNLTSSIQSNSLVLTLILPGVNVGSTKGSKDKGARLETELQQSNKKCPEFNLIK